MIKKPPVFRRLIIYLQSFTSLSINLWLDVFAGNQVSQLLEILDLIFTDRSRFHSKSRSVALLHQSLRNPDGSSRRYPAVYPGHR